jgi:hypothetical protein
MMHGRGRSDSAIVATKPTNKAGSPAVEPVEPRAGTKGNADQQSTRRAQDRESVSQALERIRQAARQRKKERFTTLLHHISIELLRLSERVNDFDTPGIGIQAWIFSVDGGGLIQAAVGLSGGFGALLTKRSGLMRNA